MKSSDLKVIAIILSVALLFTIITSNAVSIASVVMLAKGGSGATQQVQQSATGNGGTATTPDASAGTNNGGTATTPDANAGTNNGGTATTPDANAGTNNGGTATTPDANAGTNNGGTATNNGGTANNGAANNGGASGDKQMSKTEILDIYRNAAKQVKSGKAGFSRKTWQKVQSIDLGAASAVVQPIIEKFMTTEEEAEVRTYAAKDAKEKMPVSTFTDGDVKSATVETKGNNYVVTIIMNDEQSPAKGGATGVAAIAGYEILYMEDVKKEITNLGLDVSNESMNYVAFKTVAEITKDGKFVSIRQECDGQLAASIKLGFTINAKGVLQFNVHYTDFKY